MIRSLLTVVFVLVAAVGQSGCFGDDTPPAGGDVGVDASADAGADAADAQPQGIAVGESCHGPAECVEGASCIGTDQPDEFVCMKNCDEVDRICDDGSVCSPRLGAAEPICFIGGSTPRGQRCEDNLDCVPGTRCFGVNGERYCLEACHELDPGVCPEGTHCQIVSDSGKGLCRSDLGAACQADSECTGELSCSADLGAPLADMLPSGYCTAVDCTTDADCPDRGVCRTLPGSDQPLCMYTCGSDADCRFNQDYRCVDERYCQQVDNPDGCQAFRDGEDICFPVQLNPNF